MIDFILDITPQYAIAPLVLGGLLAGAGSLLGGGLSGLFGSHSQSTANNTNLQIARETNENQFKLAEYAYSKELEQWNRQNEYNDPAAQMARYRAAGLNPNLAVGNAGNASSSPSYAAPTLQRATVSPVSHPAAAAVSAIAPAIMAYQDMQMKQEQIKQISNQNSLFSTQRDLLNLRYAENQLRNKWNIDSYDYRLNLALYRANKETWLSDIAKGNALMLGDRAKILRYQSDYMLPAQLRALNSLTSMRDNQNRIYSTQADLWDSGINPSDPTWLRMLGLGLKPLMEATMQSIRSAADKWAKKF